DGVRYARTVRDVRGRARSRARRARGLRLSGPEGRSDRHVLRHRARPTAEPSLRGTGLRLRRAMRGALAIVLRLAAVEFEPRPLTRARRDARCAIGRFAPYGSSGVTSLGVRATP